MKQLIASTLFAIAAFGVGLSHPNAVQAAPVELVFAADIAVGSDVTITQTLLEDNFAEATFTPLEPVLISPIELSVTSESAADIGFLLYGLDFPASETFGSASPLGGGLFGASLTLPGFELLAGDLFSISSRYPLTDVSGTLAGFVNLTTTFSVSAIPDAAVIPLPAGLPLLIGGLGMLAVVRRRA